MTFKPARLLVALLAAIALPVLAQNVATVNGKKIPTARADAMVKQMTSQGQPDSPELRSMVKDELITREILLQEADKQGVANAPDVKAQLDLLRQSIVIRALFQNYLKKNPVTDADMRAEYEKFKLRQGDKEYRARHILVEKEEDAKAIIAKLKGGAKFEELAKQSKDPGSAANGGDLDWTTPANLVKPFSDAMTNLKKGETTETPVKTQYGYHVIRLDDVRAAKVPTFEELKPQIAEQMQQQKVQAYQQELRKKARIEG